MTKLEEIANRLAVEMHDPASAEHVAREILQNLKHGNFAMAGAATKVATLARWTPHMLWDAVIDAILEEKADGAEGS